MTSICEIADILRLFLTTDVVESLPNRAAIVVQVQTAWRGHHACESVILGEVERSKATELYLFYVACQLRRTPRFLKGDFRLSYM